MKLLNFYKDKTVMVTGHTGFKGRWLCVMLQIAGAKVIGYALNPNKDISTVSCTGQQAVIDITKQQQKTSDSLFTLAQIEKDMVSIEGDIRDYTHLKQVFEQYKPEIVFHLAAQPIVRESYANPAYTYETNVMGTVNVLECVRTTPGVKSVLNVTTDKVYDNKEWSWGYRENDALDGYDPYSNSKSCSELVTHSYKKSFFDGMGIPVSTARAGNVIGGGDFAKDRIIPDCVRAAMSGAEIVIRNPYAIRPFQHVLEPLTAYLMIAMQQFEDHEKQGYYNVGPQDSDCITVGELTDLFCEFWGEGLVWKNVHDGGPHEASFLKLDCSFIKSRIGWQPKWNIATAIEKTVEWTKVYQEHAGIRECMERQIVEFLQ